MTEEILCIWNTIDLDMHNILLGKELEKNKQSITNINDNFRTMGG